MAGQKILQERMGRGLHTDGIGNILNTFPHMTYAQNIRMLHISSVLIRMWR